MISNFERGFADQMRKIAGGYSPLGALALGGLGAAAGALVDSKKRRRGALIGGLIGALGGTAMDVSNYRGQRQVAEDEAKSDVKQDTPASTSKPEEKKQPASKPAVVENEQPVSKPAVEEKKQTAKKTTQESKEKSKPSAASSESIDNGLYTPKWHTWDTIPEPKKKPIYTVTPRGRLKVVGYEEPDENELPEPPPAKLITDNPVKYKMRPGDTLHGLAKFQFPDDLDIRPGSLRQMRQAFVNDILWSNPDINPNKIRAGQTVLIPRERYDGNLSLRDYMEMSPDEREDAYADFQRRLADEANRLGVPASDLD